MISDKVLYSLALAAALFSALPAASQPGDAPEALWGPVRLVGDEPNYLDLGVGSYSTFRNDNSGAARLEFRFGDKFSYIGPALGVLGTARGSVLGYGGLYADIQFGPVVLTPLFAVGAFHHGDRRDENLGGPLEFRSQATASYQFANQWRLGVMFAHTSNAGIYNDNPGENELMVSVAMPFGF